MPSKEKHKSRPKTTPEQRAQTIQRIVFVGFAVMIILAMILSAVATL